MTAGADTVGGKLSELKLKALTKPGRYGDGGGLWLQVRDAEHRSWLFRYSIAGRQRQMGLGPAADVTLADARELARQCRTAVRRRQDPIEDRRQAKSAARDVSTFRQVVTAAEPNVADNKPPDGPRVRTYLPPPRGGLPPEPIPAIDVAFLHVLARESGLTVAVTSAQLRCIASRITDALREAIDIAIGRPPTTPAKRRDWCREIAQKSRVLAAAFGVGDDNRQDGWAPWNAHYNLAPGIEKLADSLDLQRYIDLALPSLPRPPVRDALLSLLGRMSPALNALELIAKAADAEWSGQTRKRGSEPDEARRWLMHVLCQSFERMFGRRATVSIRHTPDHKRVHQPGGSALHWFIEFFRKLHTFLDSRPQNDPGAEVLRKMARDAMESKHGDVIVGWLRQTRIKPEEP
jgi:hypothetical protein